MATRQYFPVWPASVSSSGIVIPESEQARILLWLDFSTNRSLAFTVNLRHRFQNSNAFSTSKHQMNHPDQISCLGLNQTHVYETRRTFMPMFLKNKNKMQPERRRTKQCLHLLSRIHFSLQPQKLKEQHIWKCVHMFVSSIGRTKSRTFQTSIFSTEKWTTLFSVHVCSMCACINLCSLWVHVIMWRVCWRVALLILKYIHTVSITSLMKHQGWFWF